jgi:hypothetical protein
MAVGAMKPKAQFLAFETRVSQVRWHDTTIKQKPGTGGRNDFSGSRKRSQAVILESTLKSYNI